MKIACIGGNTKSNPYLATCSANRSYRKLCFTKKKFQYYKNVLAESVITYTFYTKKGTKRCYLQVCKIINKQVVPVATVASKAATLSLNTSKSYQLVSN